MNPIDMIWHNITTKFRAIVWAQRIMFVQDQDDMTKEIKKTETMSSEDMQIEKQEWEIQFAWDKYATYLKAQSAAMSELRSAIKQFEAIATEDDERRLKWEGMQTQIEKTRLQIEALKNGEKDTPTEINVRRWTNEPSSKS